MFWGESCSEHFAGIQVQEPCRAGIGALAEKASPYLVSLHHQQQCGNVASLKTLWNIIFLNNCQNDLYFSLTSAPMVRKFMATISLDRTPIIIPNPLSAMSTQIGCRKNPVESGLNMGWFGWFFSRKIGEKSQMETWTSWRSCEKKTWTQNQKNEMCFCKGRSSSNEFFVCVGQQTWLNIWGCLTCGLTLLSYRYGDSQSFSTSGIEKCHLKKYQEVSPGLENRSQNSKQVRNTWSISTESEIRKIQWKVKVPKSEMLSGINLFGIVERHPLNTPRSMACW